MSVVQIVSIFDNGLEMRASGIIKKENIILTVAHAIYNK